MKHNRFQVWVNLALSVLLGVGNFPLAAEAASDWYTLKTNGKPIGRVQIRSYRQSDGAKVNNVTEITNTGRFTREDNPFALNAVSRFVENPSNGKPVSFSYRYDLGPQRLLEAQGTIEGNQLAVNMVSAQGASVGRAPVEQTQFLFPGGPGIEKIYKTHSQDAPGSRFSFQTLNLGVQPEIVNSEVTLLGREKLALADGKRKALHKFEVRNPKNEASTIYEWRDAQGKLYKAQSVGSDMEMVYASRWETGPRDSETVDIVAATSVLSNRIPQPRTTVEALYRIGTLNGQSLDLKAAFPVSERQQHISEKPGADDAVYLKIRQKDPEDSSVEHPIRFDQRYLQSTPYLQATDTDIERTAVEITRNEKRAYFAARALQQWVYQNIATKDLSLGFASAKETLLSRQGDCTEHAVLLAAMARSIGIPSRVAVGLIYIPQGNSELGRFVYHMWTEVYLGNQDQGEWVPLDATNPQVAVDATHIKIADSPLSDSNDLMQLTQQVVNLAGRIKIDVLKALSPSQSVLAIGGQPGALSVAIPKIDIEQVDIRAMSRKSIQNFRVQAAPESLSVDTPDGLFTSGVEALSQGQYGTAIAAFRKAMGKLRKPIEFYRMGERLASIELYPLAREAFQTAAQKDPNYTELVDSWTHAVLPDQNLPDDLNRQFMRALSLQLDSQDGLSAASALRELIAQAPDFAPAYRHLGELLEGADAVDYLSRAVSLAPNDYRNAESLGDTLMNQKQYTQAQKAYQQAHQLIKDQAFAQAKSWPDELSGKIKLAHGSALLARNKRNAFGWLETGKGLLLQNRSEEAAKAFRNAAVLQPNHPEVQIYNFLVALRNSEWKNLNAQQGRIAPLATTHALAARLLGQYDVRVRQYPAAVAALQRAITLQPANRDAYLTLSTAYLRQAEQAESRPVKNKIDKSAQALRNQAEEILRQGLSRVSAPMDRQALSLALADLLLKHTQAGEAQQLAENVLLQDPLNPKGWLLKGKAQFYAGDNAGAAQTLETARLLSPSDSQVLTALGQVAQEEGRDSVALDFYQQAWKSDPGNVEAANALRILATQLQVSVKKPPAYWTLTGDEHAFLVHLLHSFMEIKATNLQFGQQVLKMLQAQGGKEISVQSVQVRQASVPILGKVYDQSLAQYQRLQAMQVPPRFAALHYKIQALHMANLNQYRAALQIYPAYSQSLTAKNAFRTYAETKTESQKAGAEANSSLAALGNTIPAVTLNGLLYEAQAQDLLAIDATTSQVSADIAAQLAANKESANTQKKAPNVPGNQAESQKKPTDPKAAAGTTQPAPKKEAKAAP